MTDAKAKAACLEMLRDLISQVESGKLIARTGVLDRPAAKSSFDSDGEVQHQHGDELTAAFKFQMVT